MFQRIKIRFFQNLIACKATFYLLDFFGLSDHITSTIENIHQSGWIDAQSRRKDWSDFIQVFNAEFEILVKAVKGKKFDVPYRFDTISDDASPRNGREYTNRNVAQFNMGNRPSGIGYTEYRDDEEVRVGLIVERGGAVVFSQFHTGAVGVILYPSSLDFEESNNQYKLLKVYDSPGQISKRAIRYYFHLCILHTFETSFFGHMSIFSQAYMFYLNNKANTLYVLLGGVIGFFASILATILTT
jgi:hypothetical protein